VLGRIAATIGVSYKTRFNGYIAGKYIKGNV